ncbi:MAG: heavy metal translocating P-type ATPase [Candidatus Thorarchaeota archaeon]
MLNSDKSQYEHNEVQTTYCSACEVDYSEEVIPVRQDKKIILITIAALLFITGLIIELVIGWLELAGLVFMIVAALSGFSIAKAGLRALIYRKQLNINLLVTIASVGSFLIGHGTEGTAVVFLFYIAEFLEDHSSDRARNSIAELLKLAPDVAVVKLNGDEKTLHVHDVKVNDVFIIRPGERVPLDGVVMSGSSTLNQAPITGESTPVSKEVGDEVYAGTINNEGYLEVIVTKLSSETVLSKIVKLVEESQKAKSSTEKFIDKFAKYYTPLILVLAVVVATVPTLIFGLSAEEWIYRSLVLLVVSCPCAMVISTPVAMVSGITSGARNGVLIKGSTYVEEVSRVKVFAFDKTGTLTEGKLAVTDVVPTGASYEDVLAVASSLESMSEHPIAKAIVVMAQEKGTTLEQVENFSAVRGKGIVGTIDGNRFFAGNRTLSGDLRFPINTWVENQARGLENEGKTVILVGSEAGVIGLIALGDRVRSTAANTISELNKMGIRTVMLTGDNQRTADAISEQTNIDEYRAELLPQDKLTMIQTLSNPYGSVAMVGDGVNDAPALAKANVGIAMGAIGSDVALETADIVLMNDDISKIPYLIKLSRKTMRIVKQNTIASILLKLSLAILVFPGLITLWLAVALGDMGLTLAVIANAMRLSSVSTEEEEDQTQSSM